jgi:thioredoxin 1
MRIKFASLVVLLLLSWSSCSSAADIDDSLNKAKAEGKIVMLELGSVGCIPCEQMKPVMQKLRETYTDKLEVIFIDVRVDNKTGRRFGANMIPTQVFLNKTGKEFHRHVGFYSYEEIAPILKKNGLSAPETSEGLSWKSAFATVLDIQRKT